MKILNFHFFDIQFVFLFFAFLFLPTSALSQIPKDLTALAAVCSNNYYKKSNIPYKSKLADSYSEHLDAIRDSKNSSIASKYQQLERARTRLFLLDSVGNAIASETPIKDAVEAMKINWALNPASKVDFSIDIAGAFAGKLQRDTELATIYRLGKKTNQVLLDAWNSEGVPGLRKLSLKGKTPLVKFQFGFVQNVGYGTAMNSSKKPLSNVIIIFKYKTNYKGQQKDGKLVYFVPKLNPNEYIAFSYASLDWPVSWTEDEPKKFNIALKNKSLILTADTFCDQGKKENAEISIVSGLALRMKFLRSILVSNSVFQSKSGAQIIIKKATGLGSRLNLKRENGWAAILNGKWDGKARYTDFEPRSTAFRIRFRPTSKKKKSSTGSPLLNGLTKNREARFTWRNGNLYSETGFGLSTVYYPTVQKQKVKKAGSVKVSNTKTKSPDKFVPGRWWQGNANCWIRRANFDKIPKYDFKKKRNASLHILSKNTARLTINGTSVDFAMNISGSRMKLTDGKIERSIFGHRSLLPGDWSGAVQGKVLRLKRKVRLPSKKTKTETTKLKLFLPRRN